MGDEVKSVVDEIADMAKTLEGISETAPVEGIPAEEPAEETEEVDEPEESSEEEEKADDEEDDEDEEDEEDPPPQVPEPQVTAPREEPPVDVKSLIDSYVDQNFVAKEEFDDLLDTPENINKALNKVYKQAIVDTSKAVSDIIPGIISNQVRTMLLLKTASDEFYQENEDLKPHRAKVSEIFGKVSGNHKDKDYKSLLNLVAKKARKVLKLGEKSAKKSDPPPPKLPKKAGGKVSLPPKSKTSTIHDELAAMDKVLGG